MKSFLLLISFLFCAELFGQVLVVSDEQGNPLSHFTVHLKNENRILIGGIDGRVSLEGINKTDNCGFSIRYLGYQVHQFCMSNLKTGENRIQLSPEVFELPETTIIGLSDEELLIQFKRYIAEMVDRFNVSRAFVVEKSDDFLWESLGVITLSGLKDRSKKDYQFRGGNLSFLPQYSRFWVKDVDLIPFDSRIAVASTLVQDLLFEILKSKSKDWRRVNSEGPSKELFNLESQRLEVYLNQDGSPLRIDIKQRNFRAPTGSIYQIEGQLQFIQDETVRFFSEFNFEVIDKQLTEISGVIPDFPKEINLPEKYENRSERDRLMNSFYAYTRSPDYYYDELIFKRIIESRLLSTVPNGNKKMNLVAKSYLYSELYKGNDPSSKKYLEQNSGFIREVLKVFKEYDFAW
ncbi:MAG: hypothetical protein ACK4SF_11240 [Algoriphagus aquaeductus]|uniref:hypothetical protein n=1 Tax=Algoriphagus aquaeductus TaxID=475299 RepID=UPI00391A1E7E